MKWARFSWRALMLIIWVLLGLVVLALVFPWAPLNWRQSIIQNWSRYLLWFCGVQIVYYGLAITTKPVLFVANHISWLDIFVLNRVRATAFVAKKEIRQWPLLGWLVAWAGTVFIDREQRHAIKQVVGQIQEKFAQNQAVGLFPEGATSEGLAVKSFHSSLFETAISTAMDIQPVALRFYDGERRSGRVAFTGDQSLLQNVWQLLKQSGVRIECEFLPILPHSHNKIQGRVKTARQAHQNIEQVILKGL